MKQIGLGLMMYLQDYDYYLPPVREQTSGRLTPVVWPYKIASYVGMDSPKWWESFQPALKNQNSANNIFICPSVFAWKGPRQWETPKVRLTYSPTICAYNDPYSYDPPAIGGFAYATHWGNVPGSYIPKNSKIIPANGVLIVESNIRDNGFPDSIPFHFPWYAVDPNLSYRYWWGPAYNRHNGFANFLFKDGHVEALREGTRFYSRTWVPYGRAEASGKYSSW